MRASPLLPAAVVALAIARAASAQEAQHDHPSLLDRPHTVAVLEVGILDLPNVPISQANQGGSTPFIGAVGTGDATVQTGLHLLYRATREWSFGAGALWAPRPTTDSNYYGGARGNLSRAHARSYLSLGGEARYFPLRSRWFEGWLGVTGGVVIIADRFTTNAGAEVPPILGTKIVTVSTEGLSIGVQAGADYLVTDQWVIGLALRANQWVLPGQQTFLGGILSQRTACDPVGDCPTLKDGVRAFEVGVTVGYRIAL